MRHLDLSFEGKHLAEKNQLDNGKLPHGGYRGSKKHPPSHLSYDKGREFQQRLEEELSRIMEIDDMTKQGSSPSWSILVHNSPSYTDESPLITNNLLAASKTAQINGISLYNRTSLLPKKSPPRSGKIEGGAYYRPNRMHQYLSATELKNSASEDPNIKYGRPTRTTLLRARQRSNSAPLNQLDKKRDFTQRLDEIKTAPAGSAPTTEYLQLQSVRDGESLHSYLTGARYNRAHCLDSKSVEHNGVYMPRHNPALGMFFTGPKGQEYLQELECDSPRQDFPTPPSPPTAKRRPLTAPSYGRRPVHVPGPPPYKPDHPGSSKYKYLKLNIVGSRLPLVNTREAHQQLGLKLPKLPEAANLSDRRLEEALDQTYLVNQPMPSPSGMMVHGDGGHFIRPGRFEADLTEEAENPRAHRREEDHMGVGAIRIEGRSTWKSKPVEPSSETEEEENSSRVPVVVTEEKPSLEEEQREEKEEEIEKPQAEEEIVLEEGEEKPEKLQEDEAIPEDTGEHQEEEESPEKEEQVQDKIVEENPEEEEQKQTEETLEDTEEMTEEVEADTLPENLQDEDSSVEKDEEIHDEEEIQDNSEVSVEEPQEQPEIQEERDEEDEGAPATSTVQWEEETERPDQEDVRFFITQEGLGNTGPAQDTTAEDKTAVETKDEDDPLDELLDD